MSSNWYSDSEINYKNKIKNDLEILYKAKTLLTKRVNLNDDSCVFRKAVCHFNVIDDCIETLLSLIHI